MKRFEFPLERVMAWRRLQCEREEARLEQMRGERTRLDQERRKLETDLQATERRTLEAPSITSEDLAFLDGYRDYVRDASARLAERAAKLDVDIRTQLEAVKEARRNFRLLEKLREKKWKQWEAEYDRDLELQAGESFLAKWNREARQQQKAARAESTSVAHPTQNTGAQPRTKDASP